MASLFSTPSLKNPEPAPLAPKIEDKPVQEAEAEERRKRAKARGWRSTILRQINTSRPGELKESFGT